MAKKKISISEALEAIEEQGYRAKIEPVESEQASPKPKSNRSKKADKTTRVAGSDTHRVPLRAQHCIAGTTYGPGVVSVPANLVAQLIRQDQCAMQYDEDLRNTQQKSYIVVRRQTDYGVAHVGVEVNPSLLDANSSYVFRGK